MRCRDKQKRQQYATRNLYGWPLNVVPIPWKDGRPSMPNNRAQAHYRLDNLIKRLHKKDRNTLMFLWQIGGAVVEYRMTSHLFGVVSCASSSTIALRKIVDDVSTSELVGNTIHRSFYVDDVLRYVRSIGAAVEVIEGTRQELEYVGFLLSKYAMNDAQLIQTVDVE